MNKEEMIELARYRVEQKSQERHFSDETVLNMKREYEIKCERYESEIKELESQIEKMKCCSNCKHFNKEEDIEYCWNCERQLINSLDNMKAEDIIKDEWEIKENDIGS